MLPWKQLRQPSVLIAEKAENQSQREVFSEQLDCGHLKGRSKITSSTSFKLEVKQQWVSRSVVVIEFKPQRRLQKRWFHEKNGKGKDEKCYRGSVSFHPYSEGERNQWDIPRKMASFGFTGDQRKQGHRHQLDFSLQECPVKLTLNRTRKRNDWKTLSSSDVGTFSLLLTKLSFWRKRFVSSGRCLNCCKKILLHTGILSVNYYQLGNALYMYVWPRGNICK